MMFPVKLFLTLLTVLCLSNISISQPGSLPQLKEKIKQYEQQKDYLSDSNYFNTINKLGFIYADNYPDSAISLLKDKPEQCRQINFTQGEVLALKILGNAYQTKGDFITSLKYYNQSIDIARKNDLKTLLPGIQNNIGLIYENQGNYSAALREFYEALSAAETNNNQFVVGSVWNNIAMIHFFQNKMDDAKADYHRMLMIAEDMNDTGGIVLAHNNISEINLQQDSALTALQNLDIAIKLAQLSGNNDMLASVYKNTGYAYLALDSLTKATSFFNTSITLSKQQNNAITTSKALIGLAKTEDKQNQFQTALANALEALNLAEKMGQAELQRDASEIVSTIYEHSGDGVNALKYYKYFKVYSDSLLNIQNERAALTYKADYEVTKKELEFKNATLRQQWIMYSILAALIVICVIAWMINRNRKKLNHANKILHHKNATIENEKKNAENALSQLKEAQTQLIQAEKMASLGELTAGIAHEIQNPLNFVNNFSEINKELIDELKIKNEDLKIVDNEVKDLLNDIEQNLEKINYHGKRADAIVKGMLQHSRKSSGQKEPTNINALCDEYLRLSYHGLRAKDKSFNADFTTNFDESIDKINVVPQDIGRVLLNLFNNAFYAVNEKSQPSTANSQQQLLNEYKPVVSVSTKKINDKVEIIVSDNGSGIPQNIVDKIFQPFFTTKPTGQGTGLGLSLSYDIIKAHGGNISIQSTEGEGTTFIIKL